jgi:hypothetical protein
MHNSSGQEFYQTVGTKCACYGNLYDAQSTDQAALDAAQGKDGSRACIGIGTVEEDKGSRCVRVTIVKRRLPDAACVPISFPV